MCVSPDEDGFNKDKHLKVVNYERIGPPTDMWGVGVICYILLSGSTHILFSSCIVLQINHMILLCHCSKSSSYLFQEIFLKILPHYQLLNLKASHLSSWGKLMLMIILNIICSSYVVIWSSYHNNQVVIISSYCHHVLIIYCHLVIIS